jgi:spermidine synthase
VIYLITLIVAYCSIVYELLMAQTLSALMGCTILRYSVTIGVYLASMGVGAILCKTGDEQDNAYRLIRIEIWLSIIGGMAVFAICSLDVFHRFLISSHSFFSQGLGDTLRPILFFILCHAIIVLIGILSGFEIPLLIALSEAGKPGTMNRVLGIDYFGSLLGAVLFPLLLLPKLGLFAVSYLTGLLNAIACIMILLSKPATGKFRSVKITGVVTVLLLLLLAFTDNTQSLFLKKFYYYKDIKSFTSLFNSFESHPNIQEYRSPYQHIHIVNQPDSEAQQMIYAQYSQKFTREPDFPRDVWLFLNNKYQFASNTEEFYHEFFVHVPIQWTRPPKNVLILGAGDGIVVRELLKYPEIKRITLVDLDPKMLHLAKYHPLIQRINQHSFEDPRVSLIVHDAFSWLQSCRQKFDAVYIDFPDPNTYDLAKLYSLEFYSLVRHCVSEDGFVAADIPGGVKVLWDEYYSTLKSAGFGFIKPFDTLVERENEGIIELERQFLAQAATEQINEYGYPMRTNYPNILRRTFKKLIADSTRDLRHRFIFLQLKRHTINPRFKDYGIPLHVMNETRFKLTSNIKFDDTFKPDRVNSVFRPTMPPFDFFSVNFPY